MVEIIATVYLTCFTLSWIAGLSYLNLRIQKQYRSHGLTTLNNNLARVGLFWSNRNANFLALAEGSPEEDHRSVKKSFLLMTTILSLLSVFGFILLILMMFTGRPRREKRTFQSDLAQKSSLSLVEVETLVAELKNIY